MKHIAVLILISFCFIMQAVEIKGQEQWVKTYSSGVPSGSDLAVGITSDNSSNIYVIGHKLNGSMRSDYLTLKYSSAGDLLWVKSYDGGSGDDDISAVAVDNQGNVYVTGESDGPGDQTGFLTIKYNSQGDQQWAVRYDETGQGDEAPEAIAVDNSGNVYVAGSAMKGGYAPDYALVKYNSAGTKLWAATYNGPGNSHDEISSMVLDNSGNIYVTGISSGGIGAANDIATLKYDSGGQLLWTARYNGPSGQEDFGSAIALCSNGDVVVTGGSMASGASTDIITLKYNNTGSLLWEKRYNGSASLQDIGNALVIDQENSIYIAGQTNSSSSSTTAGDLIVIKYLSDGTQAWLKTLNGSANAKDWASSAALGNDGAIYVSGTAASTGSGADYLTIKYRKDGTQEWTGLYNSLGSSVDQAEALTAMGAGIYVTGSTGIDVKQGSITTIKYAADAPPPPPSLAAPVLITPAHNASIPDTKIKFIWHKSQNASSYQLQVSEGQDFSTLLADQSSISDTLKELSIFQLNKTYYWRVRAHNQTQTSSWSAVSAFNTNTSAAVKMSIGSAGAVFGDTVTIPVNVSEFNGIGAITIKIGFDPSQLRFLNILNMNSKLTEALASESSGVITMAWDGENGVNIGTGKLFDLKFIYKGPSIITAVEFLPQTEIVNLSGFNVNPILSNGYISFGFSLSGLLTYDCESAIPIINSVIYLIQDAVCKDSVIIGNDGFFQFLSLLQGIYGCVIKTKMPWGGVNSTDALLIRKHIVGHITLQGLRLRGSDVNNINGINSTDPLMIRRRVVGLENSFALGDWIFDNVAFTLNNPGASLRIKGLAVGDVNGSYGTNNGVAQSVSVNMEEMLLAGMAEEFSVPLSLKSNAEIGAITLFVNFPAELADLKTIAGKPDGFLYNVVGNQIRIAWDDITPVSIKAGEALFTLVFKPKGQITQPVKFNIEIDRNSEFADRDGNVLSLGLTTSVAKTTPPADFSIKQNYPNPFNPSTTIEYSIPVSGRVTLDIFNTLGEKVAELVNSSQLPGIYKVDWKAEDQRSGIYFYRINLNSGYRNYTESRKMLLLK